MNRLLAFGLAVALCFALSASAADKPMPTVSKILDKASLAVKKNREDFAKANEAPLAEARKELEEMAKKLVDSGKADEAAVVLKQVGTLEADVIGRADAPAPAVVSAKTRKESTLRDKIQGKWTKTNQRFSFEIKGNEWLEFQPSNPSNPLKPTNSGIIEFPPGKEYAVVTARPGHRLWIWPVEKDVIAVETFLPDGTLWEDGRVFYRFGTTQP